jgi:hypothetical protein
MKAAFVVFLAMMATPALAEEGHCAGVVSFGDESGPLRLMRVETAAPKVHFIENRAKAKPTCPAMGETCQRKGFVVPGDVVLAVVPKTPEPFTCVSYVSPGARRVKGMFRGTDGYLPAGALKEVPAAAPQPGEWLGKWSRDAEADIVISTLPGGKLKVKGEATFGALDPGRVQRGAVNIGELEGEVAPKGNMIPLGEGYDGTKPFGDDRAECRAKLRLYGRYLVVEDNGGCGGMNVSFTGIYVQLKP